MWLHLAPFAVFTHMSGSVPFQLWSLGCGLSFTRLREDTGRIPRSVGFSCRVWQSSSSGYYGTYHHFLQHAVGSALQQCHPISCMQRCGNKRWSLPLSPNGVILANVRPAISLTLKKPHCSLLHAGIRWHRV